MPRAQKRQREPENGEEGPTPPRQTTAQVSVKSGSRAPPASTWWGSVAKRAASALNHFRLLLPSTRRFVWVKNTAGGDVFRVYLTDLDVDGLKKAIKAELGTDYTGNAPAIKIYDHQGQAMEHPEQAVPVNTSEAPYLYQLPIVWVCDSSDASPYPLTLPALNVAQMRHAVKARLQGEQASVEESAIKIYDHQGQAMEHPEQAVPVNTSKTPYFYRIPAPGTISELSHFYSLLADKQSAAQGSTDVAPDERLPDITAGARFFHDVLQHGPDGMLPRGGFE